MKFQKLVPLALLAFSFSALTFTACKKEETDPNNNNNNNNNNNTEWNWNGTAPFSVKMDGTAFAYDTAIALKSGGYIAISANKETASGPYKTFGVVIPETAAAGTEYATPTVAGATFSFTDGSTTEVYGCQSGKIKVISISGTEVEGKFYGTMKHMSNTTTKEVKEGYFKIKF